MQRHQPVHSGLWNGISIPAKNLGIPYVVKVITSFIAQLGYDTVKLRSDHEPAIKKVKGQIPEALSRSSWAQDHLRRGLPEAVERRCAHIALCRGSRVRHYFAHLTQSLALAGVLLLGHQKSICSESQPADSLPAMSTSSACLMEPCVPGQ